MPKVVHIGGELRLGMRRMHVVKKPIEALPLFAGDLFAHLAGIFAGAVQAECDRDVVGAVEDQVSGSAIPGRRSI